MERGWFVFWRSVGGVVVIPVQARTQRRLIVIDSFSEQQLTTVGGEPQLTVVGDILVFSSG